MTEFNRMLILKLWSIKTMRLIQGVESLCWRCFAWLRWSCDTHSSVASRWRRSTAMCDAHSHALHWRQMTARILVGSLAIGSIIHDSDCIRWHSGNAIQMCRMPEPTRVLFIWYTIKKTIWVHNNSFIIRDEFNLPDINRQLKARYGTQVLVQLKWWRSYTIMCMVWHDYIRHVWRNVWQVRIKLQWCKKNTNRWPVQHQDDEVDPPMDIHIYMHNYTLVDVQLLIYLERVCVCPVDDLVERKKTDRISIYTYTYVDILTVCILIYGCIPCCRSSLVRQLQCCLCQKYEAPVRWRSCQYCTVDHSMIVRHHCNPGIMLPNQSLHCVVASWIHSILHQWSLLDHLFSETIVSKQNDLVGIPFMKSQSSSGLDVGWSWVATCMWVSNVYSYKMVHRKECVVSWLHQDWNWTLEQDMIMHE